MYVAIASAVEVVMWRLQERPWCFAEGMKNGEASGCREET